MAVLSLRLARRMAGVLSPLRTLCANGWIREADVDFFLRFLNPALALTRVHAKVLSKRWVAEDMAAFTLRCNGNARGWRAGQHVQLFIELDGIRQSRTYSLTSVQANGVVELAIKRQPGGRFSNWLLDQLMPGQVVELSQAQGEMSWPDDGRGVVLVAAGSGITPLLGLLREALANGFNAPLTFVHQVRNRTQQAFADELKALSARYPNLQLRLALSGEAAQTDELGRLQPEDVQQLPGAHLLACGPRGFVEKLAHWWEEAQRGGSVQLESFSPLEALPVDGAGSVQLAFSRSRQHVLGNSGQSLLEQAEANGLSPAFGCRQGVCTTCTCTLVAGTVRDLRSGALFAEPGQPIRLCVSAPHGDVEIDL